ncbi:MAG TPA: MBL fold metallo-hydrolase, partial [Planctomycetota bacterium]|nr:MBL fold metallo-hydrolase [Planctomycetota bacterium]
MGSGSRGNCVLVSTGRVRVVVDCGFHLKETRERLGRAGVEVERLDAVLLTHEHHDHVQGAGPVSNGFKAPVFATAGTQAAAARALKSVGRCEPMAAGASFVLGDLEIEPVGKPHDAAEPTSFLFHHGGLTLGVFTDLGSVDAAVGAAISRCDALCLEANHDPARLRAGPYPPRLKARIASERGHLSNEQSARAVARWATPRLKRLVVCHLSETNNTADDVKRAFLEHM